ncbi:MAG TPA: hypothetical protein VN923_18940 [Thermoanaerobaculia bacterium]|nr:hypothetical protein [Thermoanaerobaculia bacterium]
MRDRAADRRLMRYLHGELPAEQVRQLRAELAKSPALQARLAELHRLWQGLQPSAPTPAPFGYVPKLTRLAEQKRVTVATRALGWSAAPPWVRAMAAAALVAGVALGVGLGRMPHGAQAGAGPVVAAVPSGSQVGAPEAASAGPSPAASVSGGVEVTPSAATTPSVADTTPKTAGDAVPMQPRESDTAAPADIDSAEAMLADESVSMSGSTTLAEEYWQALEGTGSDDGGGGGDAGW